mmetsp:Transcript_45002/g.105138  ORF Transcript_45002/g.105138 Transcript_45002/m.105138 type:complete len:235 (-) Transcript_45002:483-1187(-)
MEPLELHRPAVARVKGVADKLFNEGIGSTRQLAAHALPNSLALDPPRGPFGAAQISSWQKEVVDSGPPPQIGVQTLERGGSEHLCQLLTEGGKHFCRSTRLWRLAEGRKAFLHSRQLTFDALDLHLDPHSPHVPLEHAVETCEHGFDANEHLRRFFSPPHEVLLLVNLCCMERLVGLVRVTVDDGNHSHRLEANALSHLIEASKRSSCTAWPAVHFGDNDDSPVRQCCALTYGC